MLDAFFLERLRTQSADDQVLAGIAAMLADERVEDLSDAADRVGIGRRGLPRLLKRHLGFPPKPLLMQARFMSALTATMLNSEESIDVGPPGYYDASHYIRDSNRFLGMTPRRFAARPNPWLRAKLRACLRVLGAASPVLDMPARWTREH